MVRRRLIAIGDLHGDVHRLVRILERYEVLIPKTRTWARSSGSIDLVLLGDYVDWRGESLEGDPATWERGVADLLDLIMDLHRQAAEIQATCKHNRSRFFPLLGNHDKLMLDSHRYLSSLPDARRDAIAAGHSDPARVRKALGIGGFLSRILPSKKGGQGDAERLLTWLSNGGVSTISSFGGFDAWYRRMNAGLASFIDQRMRLGVVLNGRLYSHSVPDASKWWRPVDEVDKLPAASRDEALEEWLWGRRMYGVDHRTGREIPRPQPAEVDLMLDTMGVKGVVVGHSLMQSLVPVKAYDGKVVNIDLHGHPLSEPWLDEYEEPG